MSVLRKEFYGSSKYAVEIYSDSSYYHADMKGKVLFYQGRHLDQEKSFTTFSNLAKIIRDYWATHVGEVFDRRLASWFVEYGIENGYNEQSITEVLSLIKGEIRLHDQEEPNIQPEPQDKTTPSEATPPLNQDHKESKPKPETPRTVQFSSKLDVTSLEQAVLQEAEKLKHKKAKSSSSTSIVKKTEIQVENLDKEVIEKVRKQSTKTKKRKRAPRK